MPEVNIDIMQFLGPALVPAIALIVIVERVLEVVWSVVGALFSDFAGWEHVPTFKLAVSLVAGGFIGLIAAMVIGLDLFSPVVIFYRQLFTGSDVMPVLNPRAGQVITGIVCSAAAQFFHEFVRLIRNAQLYYGQLRAEKVFALANAKAEGQLLDPGGPKGADLRE